MANEHTTWLDTTPTAHKKEKKTDQNTDDFEVVTAVDEPAETWVDDTEVIEDQEEEPIQTEEQAREHFDFGNSENTMNVRMFLGNLHFKVLEEQIKDFFKKCGTIHAIQFLTDKETGKFYGSGFATFDSMNSAKKAVVMNGKKLIGRPIKIGFASNREATNTSPEGWGATQVETHADEAMEGDEWQAEKQTAAPVKDDWRERKSAKESANSKAESVSTDCRIFLGSLPFKITEELLRETFTKCGEILDIYWITDKNTGKFYGSAIATFKTTEAAQAAQKLSGTKVMDREIKVGWASAGAGGGVIASDKGSAQPLSKKPVGCYTVFVGNLPFDIEEPALRTSFEHCGNIKDVRFLMRDGKFKGCGFVDFHDPAAVEEAIKLNGTVFMGRAMRVDYN